MRGARPKRRMQAARAASVGFGAVAGFQIALAAGAPWGKLAWGGAGGTGVLPASLRVASVVSAAVWVGAGRVVLARGAGRGYERTTWGLAGLLVLGSAMNAVSPSRAEARLWTPASLTLAALTAEVARSQRSPAMRAASSAAMRNECGIAPESNAGNAAILQA